MDHTEQHIRITVSRPGADTVEITVTGDLDRRTVPAFDEQVTTALNQHHTTGLNLNLADLEFCDLAGLRALHTLGETVATTGRRAHITAAHPQLDVLLRLCNIPALLDHAPPPATDARG